ncbi:translocation/assembly module TamB domain-containing protein [Acidovorax sp.]|uniref:translocation/assembly module TamB domain-containing protein n=1 Tax=Acidovorax sp. TaxID=1872122 RepID=UPI0026124564|nr:translocation/assembly module TamB domain-containing protein [Acidovorax sp.]
MNTPTPPTRPRPRASDFSAGSSSARRPPPPQRPRATRVLRALGRLLLVLAVLLITAAALLWWWTGSNTSLATVLAKAAQALPAEQKLESRDTTGSLRSGGRIGWLRWSSPSLTVEVTDLRLGWQLALPALLQRRLELGEVHAARVQLTPLPTTEPSPPPTPLTELVLPLQLSVPFRVDQLQWAGPPAVEALGLEGDYRFDGRQHRLNIGGVELAQGRYSAHAALDALAPMALNVTVNGDIHTAVPGGGADLHLGAQATLQGTLATADAQLQLQAQVTPAPSANDSMQAQVQAALAPWAPQPLQSASATLQAVNLAALWPQAPATQLHGTVQAGPTPGTAAGWSLQAQLRNNLPGPWDQARLPLTALQASAHYDGTRWTVPSATLQVGAGSITAQGHYTPATHALDGQAELRALRPDALHTLLAAAPLSGRLSAQTQGDGVRFSADVRAAAPATTENAKRTAPLRINAFSTQGTWQAPAGGTVQLDRLLLDALQARVEATGLRVALGNQSAQGKISVTVPGATAQAQGTLAAQTGAGDLQLQWSDPQRTQRWLTGLPLVGADLQRTLQGASAQGAAQLSARWKGGWQTLAQQLQAASTGNALPRSQNTFELQATLNAPQLDLALPTTTTEGGVASGTAAQTLQLRAIKAELSGSLAQASLALSGELRTPAPQAAHATLQTRISGSLAAAGQWQAQIQTLRLQAQAAQRPGPWALQLSEPLSMTVRTTFASASPTSPALSLQTSAGQARLTGPLPGTVALRWLPVRWSPAATGGTLPRLQTQGTLQGLPTAWVDALGLGEETPATSSNAGRRPTQPLLARMGLASSIVIDGQWSVDTMGDTLRASASLRRASGDLRILAGDATAVTAVQSRGQGTGAGATTAVATETSQASTPGTPAGVRQAEISVEAEGDAVRARLVWASDRAGEIDASANTRVSMLPAAGADPWAANAPLAGTLRARLPDVGVWSALAPPGWRVRGTLDASATLSGTRDAPRWAGTLGADDMALRSVVDGVDLQGGRLRATLQGNQLNITEFRLQGGHGSRARITGFSGNRTAAPQDGGTLTATGRITWGDSSAAARTGQSGIAMSLQAEAKALQVLVRADRQVSVSGKLQAQLQQGQISLRGQLTTDRATIILPDESAPSLGADVVVRSAVKDREAQAKAQAAAQANQAAAQAETAKPPDIAITLNLGQDFALQGQGITTRLTGELDIRSSAVPGAPPRVTGEVRTDQGRYRAWGQVLDVETGLIRFNGPYNNPSLDILALRPNISVRAGVQVTGSAQAPRVKLYSDPDLPDAEKLSWVVLGRSASAGGAEGAMLQQAALALLGRNGSKNPTANAASRLGLDEIGFRGAGDDASAAALTFGKRLSSDLYVTYERSLSGTLGTLYIFYDLSRRITLRGQTGEKSAVDIIYTVKYD